MFSIESIYPQNFNPQSFTAIKIVLLKLNLLENVGSQISYWRQFKMLANLFGILQTVTAIDAFPHTLNNSHSLVIFLVFFFTCYFFGFLFHECQKKSLLK